MISLQEMGVKLCKIVFSLRCYPKDKCSTKLLVTNYTFQNVVYDAVTADFMINKPWKHQTIISDLLEDTFNA